MPNYSVDQLYAKLERADAAGDAEAAKVIADEIRRVQAGASNSDFSNVRGSDGKTASQRKVAASQPKASLFRNDSDFQKRSGLGGGAMFGAAVRDMFGGDPAQYLADKSGGTVANDANGDPLLRLPDGTQYRLNDPGLDSTDIANVAGNVAAFFLPASWAARAGQARNAGLLGRMALQGGAAAGTDMAIQAGVNNGQVDMKRAALVGAGGAGGEVLGTGLRTIGARAGQASNPLRQRAIEVAQDASIPLHISQLSQSIPVKTMASVAKYLPFSWAGKAAQRQQSAYVRALGRTAGIDEPVLTDEVMRAGRNSLSNEFGNLYRGREIAASDDLMRRLAEINNSAAQDLTDDQAKLVAKQFDKIAAKVAESGAMTGEQYQALRTSLANAAPENNTGRFIKQMRRELDNAANIALGPEGSARLKSVQGKWANLRTLEGLLKQVSGAAGEIKPASVWPAIRNGSTQEMRDLGRVGQLLLKDPIPDSGTAGRVASLTGLSGLGLGSGGTALPGIAALLGSGATVGRLLNSPIAADALLGAQKAVPVASKSLARVAPASGALVVSKKRRRDKRDDGK